MSWSSDNVRDASLRLLDLIEDREYELLLWGYLNGHFSEDELMCLADDVADDWDLYVSPADMLHQLVDHKLLFQFHDDDEIGYRSRFAEGVRLFAQLRQIFNQSHWRDAPQLVADYRLAIEPRRYPSRHIPPGDVAERLSSSRQLSPTEAAVLERLLQTASGGEYLLADFQVAAMAAIRSRLTAGRGGGVIVCAGTGTGKTLGFYLPCLMDVASGIDSTQPWTQAIAIYPRVELLRDQFCEVFAQARRLADIAVSSGGRRIRIGAYYGATPHAAERKHVENRWPKHPGGFECPFMSCPKCGRPFLWTWQDLKEGRERLTCATSDCGCTVGPDELVLTRERLRQTPPDVLFTTTEMLNRKMSDLDDRHIFGLGQSRRRSPRMMLLDEAHAYSGTHGANVGLLIRRWRAMTNSPVLFVGLSATLTDPQGFFGDLVGLYQTEVTAVDAGEDLEEGGHEYHLILRGDPVSRTSLLSTSIQAVMLAARLLDPPDQKPSDGVCGTRLFVFTDDLDVTNRLYHYLQDAEALDSRGRSLSRKEPLASLRAAVHPEPRARFHDGQCWTLCEWIGHSLQAPGHRLALSRTSSQDTGVDTDSQVVVATASLELGYDDPEVGAILQHKSPRDPAQFVQRRGRAGRRRVTRPWTIVVLSDYGRDRMTYQFYEAVFSPELPRPPLPVRNRYVLRIQMVYALMDWFADKLRLHGPGSVWSDFAAPGWSDADRQRQADEAEMVKELLRGSSLLESLQEHLRKALQIDEEEVQALLWEPPRALSTVVLPTLLRRLATQWTRVCGRRDEPELDYHSPGHPLPDFIPQSLFSDLKVPDVRIVMPQQSGGTQEEYMPITQALRTVAPGKVTHRFGTKDIRDMHWVPPVSLDAAEQSLDLFSFCSESESLGNVEVGSGETVRFMPCIRPWEVHLCVTPADVASTSNAFLDWRSQLFVESEGVHCFVPQVTRLSELVREVRFFTHNSRCPVTVRRFAVGSKASVRRANGAPQQMYIEFADGPNGPSAALGVEQEVDGVRFGCQIPDWLLDEALSEANLRSIRIPYFQHAASADQQLAEGNHPLTVEWLVHVYLSWIIAEALAEKASLSATINRLTSHFEPIGLETLLVEVFRTQEVLEATDGASPEVEREDRDLVHHEVRALLAQRDVRERLAEHAKALHCPPTDGLREWTCNRLLATVGGALVQACRRIAPAFAGEDLYLDIDDGPPPTTREALSMAHEPVWVTEATVGGTGVIEEIHARYAEDPERFLLLVEAALGLTAQERVDEGLLGVLSLSRSSPSIADAMAAVRGACDNASARAAQGQLRHALLAEGIAATPGVSRALNARVLRPGSSSKSDQLLRDLIAMWDENERDLGVEVDLRLFCHAVSQLPEVDEAVLSVASEIAPGHEGHHLNVQAILYSMLWPRGVSAREEALDSYNPYTVLPRTDPKIVRDAVLDLEEAIMLDDPEWADRAKHWLATSGRARVSACRTDASALKMAILQLLTEPVHAGFLQVYPIFAQIQADGPRLVATLHLKEAWR